MLILCTTRLFLSYLSLFIKQYLQRLSEQWNNEGFWFALPRNKKSVSLKISSLNRQNYQTYSIPTSFVDFHTRYTRFSRLYPTLCWLPSILCIHFTSWPKVWVSRRLLGIQIWTSTGWPSSTPSFWCCWFCRRPKQAVVVDPWAHGIPTHHLEDHPSYSVVNRHG